MKFHGFKYISFPEVHISVAFSSVLIIGCRNSYIFYVISKIQCQYCLKLRNTNCAKNENHLDCQIELCYSFESLKYFEMKVAVKCNIFLSFFNS